MSANGIAIVGAGQAGAAIAARLRRKGFAGPLAIYGDEPAPPYQRPPLSKKYLDGAWPAERLWLRPAEFWREQEIDLRLGGVVQMIDPELGNLICDGELHSWGKLALATGAAPRPLPPHFENFDNVHVLRSLGDVDRLRPAFRQGRRLLVVGGGYIGLETAAVAVKAGLSVTVVERAPRILERVACIETADAIRAMHKDHGVTILEGVGIASTSGGSALEAVGLDDGSQIPCDLVVVGIGVLPRTELAEAAGVNCANGVLVDAFGRSSAAGLWAAGDCACFPLDGQPTRLESVQNAIDQAEVVADDMLGEGRPYRPVPWFWSDQYDSKLQIVGLNRGYDFVVAHPSARGRSHWYFAQDRLLAVDALDDSRAYMAARKLLEQGRPVSRAQVDRPDFDPMALLKG
jgi:3-phenylpropionate/trans-cinnamate dioxygenase ferredoxin reductase subunit